MKGLIVLVFDLPDDPTSAADVLATSLRKINPPRLPGFDGNARVAVTPHADVVLSYLDEDD